MRLNRYITESNDLIGALKKIDHMPFQKLEKFLKDQFETFTKTIKTLNIENNVLYLINKAFDTRYFSLDEILRDKVQPLKESDESVNEDLAHWWDLIKSEAFPTLAFYPALQVWLEIDKLVKGQDINMRAVIIYSVFWILLVSGKYVKGWIQWKKQNPDEYQKEREQGKGGII